MREESEYMFDEGQTLEIVQKYESMLERREMLFFDVYEFEHIIDYYLNNQNSNRALQAANMAQRMHPYSCDIQLRRAELLVMDEKPDDALRMLKALSQIEAHNSEVHFITGNAQLQLNNYKAADESFANAIGCEREDPAFLMHRISALYQEIDEFNIAIRHLQGAYKVAPRSLNVLFDIAYCYERIDDLDRSEWFYNLYLDINAFSTNVWYNLGIVYARKGDLAKAIEAYDYALAIDPINTSSMHNLASTLAITEKYEEAIEFFRELAQLEPENSKVFCSIGECYVRLKRSADAINAFEESLAIDPATAEAQFGIGMVMLEQKNYQSAREYMMKAIAIDSENYDFWLGLAHVNFELDLYKETLEAYHEAIMRNSLEPDAFVGLSEVLLHYRQYAQIENLYQDIALNFSDVPMLKVILAAAQYLSNKPADALNTLKIAKNQDSEAVKSFLSFVSIADTDFRRRLSRI